MRSPFPPRVLATVNEVNELAWGEPMGFRACGGSLHCRSGGHQIVQRHAHTAWSTSGGNFRTNLEADPDVTGCLSPQQLAACFATDLHQSNLRVIWERLGI